MATNKLVYSASQPIGGPATRAEFKNDENNRGLVPYFVSGPLSRKGMAVGFIGTILHVIAWLLALIFDIVSFTYIDPDMSPAAWSFGLYSLITLVLAFVILFALTSWHLCGPEGSKIPEGGAPPWVMTLLIGGAQIAAVLTALNLISTSIGGDGSWKPFYSNNTLITGEEAMAKTNEWRNFNIWSLIFKLYIMQFLRNNQEWAGPAATYKGESF